MHPRRNSVARRSIQLALPALAMLLLAVPGHSQQPEDTERPQVPADEFDRGSPRGSAEGFLNAVDQGDYATAAEYLDTRNLRGPARD